MADTTWNKMLRTNGVSSISHPQMFLRSNKAEKTAQAKGKGRCDSTHIPETAAILVSIGGRLQDVHGTWWDRK